MPRTSAQRNARKKVAKDRRFGSAKHGEQVNQEDLDNMNCLGQTLREKMQDLRLPDVQELAYEEKVKRAEKNYARMTSEGFTEKDYGDGDQRPVKKPKDQLIMLSLWGQGGDYNPLNDPLTTAWCKACYNGDVEQIKMHLDNNDAKILDRRESVLRMAGINHVIAGARSYSPNMPVGDKVKTTSRTDYEESLNILIKAGANVNTRDFAGFTPIHHCTTIYANKMTLKLAEILIKAGSEVNLKNRLGCTPIFEPTMAGRIDLVEFLLEHGADIDVQDVNGIKLLSLTRNYPKLQSLFSDHMSKMGAKDKEKMRAEGNYKTCVVCKKDRKCSRCVGCFNIWYCSKDCQKNDWGNHKEDCKKGTQGFMEVSFMKTGVMPSMNFKTGKVSTKCFSVIPIKSHFIVKVQVPVYEAQVAVSKGYIMMYNKDRSVHGGIHSTQPIYDPLYETVTTYGVAGKIKGYFSAIFKGGKLMINPYQIQAPEPW